MTRLAQRVGPRARLAVLCVALPAGVPGHALASVDRAVAAAVEVALRPCPARRQLSPLMLSRLARSGRGGAALGLLTPGAPHSRSGGDHGATGRLDDFTGAQSAGVCSRYGT